MSTKLTIFLGLLIAIMLPSEIHADYIEKKFVTNVQLKQMTVTALLEHYAEEYKVDPNLLYLTVKCESGLNPKAINHTTKEYSVGIAQINLKAHKNITEAQAKDPVFSAKFIAKEFAANRAYIWTCYNKINAKK